MDCANAADNGNLALLQQLRETRHPWDENTCANTASMGHFEILQWARAQGCPWDKQTCSAAALEGYLVVLQWARAQGCPWGWGTGIAAAVSGNLDVLVWIYENDGAYREPIVTDIHDNCIDFWETYAVPYWSQGIIVPVEAAPKPAKK